MPDDLEYVDNAIVPYEKLYRSSGYGGRNLNERAVTRLFSNEVRNLPEMPVWELRPGGVPGLREKAFSTTLQWTA